MGIFSNLVGLGKKKAVSETKTKISEEINIMDAINAHVRWKIRLDKYLMAPQRKSLIQRYLP